MRVQASGEGRAQAGLEEALTAPTIVSRVSDSGVQIARRGVGRVIGSGTWAPTPSAVGPGRFSFETGEIPRAARAAADGWLLPGLAFLEERRQRPAVQAVAGRLDAQGAAALPVRFVEDHASLFDWRPGGTDAGGILLDATVSHALSGAAYAEGRAVLSGLLLHHMLARSTGSTERQAYHHTIAFYESLTDEERAALRGILNTPWIDHGNTLLTFLRLATSSEEADADLADPRVRGVDSMRLEREGAAEGDPDKRALFQRTVHHRDRMVSWLMGQVRIDLPYDRRALREAATDEDRTLDERRQAAYEVVGRYDKAVEAENARRVSDHVRAAVPAGYPPPVVVAGRLSRAYSDQAGLFADATLVPKSEAVVRAVERLSETAEGTALLEGLRQKAQADPRLGAELNRLADGIEGDLTGLQPALTRLRLLAFGPDRVGPMTQYRGALHQLREALAVFRLRQGQAIRSVRKAALDEAREGTARRAAEAQTAAIEARIGPFEGLFQAFAGETGQVEQAIRGLERALSSAETTSAAFSVQLQRPSRTGSINLFDANELIPAPEQEPSLRKLARLGGHNTYASPDYEWVAHATDVIEAAPLSIYERVIEVDGKHVTVVEVDQEALEQTIRTMADYWARNIEATMDSEHAALAREAVVEANSKLRSQAETLRRQRGLSAEASYLQVIRAADERTQTRVARVAAWIAREFDRQIEPVERRVEEQWARKHFVTRLEAVRRVVIGRGEEPAASDYRQAVRKAGNARRSLERERRRLQPAVTRRRREPPAFHMLTTEAPGLVEGFIQTVLEEEMALRNVIRGEGERLGKDLEKRVQEKLDAYRARFDALAEAVTRQFGYDVIVESLVRSGQSRSRALAQVIGGNATLQAELARMAVLAEVAEAQAKAAGKDYRFDPADPDHPRVDEVLKERSVELESQARQGVAERNRLDSDFKARVEALKAQMSEAQAVARAIAEDPALTRELEATQRQLARSRAFDELAREHADWHLEARLRSWVRDHTSLAKTTARREVVAAEGLQAAMMDPRYYYGSGAVFQADDGTFRVSGRRKRYHLIYANSRVNLGKGERDSVEVLPQWVGVTDPLAARHAEWVYSLINFYPQVRTIKEVENLKVSENEQTALRRAAKNAQAYFSESLGLGDSEDLSYQFNLRGGWLGASGAASGGIGSGFEAGPTTGYCIPKDPLFKLLRNSLKDPQKLTQAGIPKHLHAGLFRMIADLEARRGEFQSEGAFENWMAEQMLSPERLAGYFGPGEEGAQARAALSEFIEVTGGVIVFHLSKIHEILGNLGRTSLLATHGHDLGLLLWSAWAGDKVTLGGEQVNRSVVFQAAEDIFKLRDEAERLNPQAGIPAEGKMRVHGYWPYKTDPDHPSPPDVRDNFFGRIFMILSGRGELVAQALDEKGQRIYWAQKRGLRLDSDDPRDHQAARLLAEEYLGITEGQIRRTDWFRQRWDRLRAETDDPNAFAQAEEALLNAAFAAEVRRLKKNGERALEVTVLEKEFQGRGTVGFVSGTAVPGVSTDDILGFKPDAKTALIEQADEAQAILQSYGVSVEQMEANAQLQRPLEEWVPVVDLPEPQRQALLAELAGGKHHPLAFRLRGPGTDFRQDLQGQDVLVLIGPHPDLLALNPSEVRDLMLTGRPNSALGIRDGGVQGRHRVWFDRDVMLWYAAARGVDQKGQIITDWNRRDSEGRRSVYTAFGWGARAWKPLLGTNLREEVVRQEHRAARLFEALKKVAEAGRDGLNDAAAEARAVFARELPADQMRTEAAQAAQYQQFVQTQGVARPRDNIIRQHLEDLARDLPLERFSEAHWLSAGGMFLLNGAPRAQQEEALRTLRQARKKLERAARQQSAAGASAPLGTGLEEPGHPEPIRWLITPQLPVSQIARSERKGTMFSVKASEQQPARALAWSKALQAEAARQATLALREEGFEAALQDDQPDELAAARQDLAALTEGLSQGAEPEVLYRRVGALTARAVKVMRNVNGAVLGGDTQAARAAGEKIEELITGRGLDKRAVGAFIGTYEEPGVIPQWFEAAGEDGRARVAEAAGLFHAALALEATAPYIGRPATQVEGQLWRSLSEFFSLTLDDHFYEYNPWVFDPKRGSGFSDFYDELGMLKPERAEELYTLSWNHHRLLYGYLRTLIVQKSPLRELPERERDLLLGKVALGDSADQDVLEVQAIGAGAPTDIERKWRAYGQLRETAFMRNDGFALPVVFEAMDPGLAEVLDASRRVNFAFLSPTGRPHYARAAMEAGALGENIFTTRDGRLVQPEGARGEVLQIDDAHFWLTEEQYRQALVQVKEISPAEADAQVERDRAAGRLTPKGIRVAARFTAPVNVGSVVSLHHHPLGPALTAAGYPYTDKSDVLFEITYNKSLYPAAFNPPHRTGVLLPPQIDWLRAESEAAPSEAEAKARILERLRPFAKKHGTIVVKGAAESGSRNFKRFDLAGEDGLPDEEGLRRAADFIYEVSKGQNVVIQAAVITTPLAWMSAQATRDFVNRQIADWGVAVDLERHPKSWVYGTVRGIVSAGMPASMEPTEAGLFNPDNWRLAHRIFLNSLQVATNVGRQGTLERLDPERVRPEFRETFLAEMEGALQRTMAALARYGRWYWDNEYVPADIAEHGEPPRELDAAGVPYWWPRYGMLDLIPEPVWGRGGVEVPRAQVVDIVPGDPAQGTENRFLLEPPEGEPFWGKPIGFKFRLLEPNVGIGLWPNYWLRELFHEERRAEAAGEPADWLRVGQGDRQVLSDYLDAGEAFLRAKFGPDYFGPGGPSRTPVAAQTAPPAPSAREAPFQAALTSLRAVGMTAVGPNQAAPLLAEAAVNALGGRAALAQEPPEALLERAERWLADPQRAADFPQGPGISVTGEQVGRWLQDDASGLPNEYRRRVAELALDRVLSEPLTPPVEMAPEPVSAEGVTNRLPHAKTFAVVTGKTALMNHHFYPWAIGRASAEVNVIGVHESWLTSDGRARRVMMLDPVSGRPVELPLARPAALTHAFITELPADEETAAHRRLDDRLSSAGVHLLNPALPSNVRADDKRWLRDHAPAGVTVPSTWTLPQHASPAQAEEQVRAAASAASGGLVIQPAADTTEAEGVRWFPAGDPKAAAHYAAKLSASGPVLISPYHGNVTYQGRAVAFRFNVTGGRVASASAVVAAPGSRIAHVAAGGEVLPLGQVLEGLQGPDGEPAEMTPAAWRRLANQAEEAVLASGLGAAGVDLVVDRAGEAPGGLQGVVLEINARPGLMIFGEEAFFTVAGVESRPASPAGPGFWEGLAPLSLELAERTGRPVIRQVMVVAARAADAAALREMIRRDHPWVDIVTFDDVQAANAHFRNMRAGTIPPVGAILVAAGGFSQGQMSELDLFLSEGMFPTHLLSAAAFEPDRLQATQRLVNRYLEEVGVHEVLPLADWRRAVEDPEGSGLRAAVARMTPRENVEAELERIRDLVEEAAERTVETGGASEPLFDPRAPLALSFAPGRVRFFMGHTDLRGLGGQTINAATHYGMWALTQMIPDGEGRVVADNLDPRHDAFEFNLSDEGALPPQGISSIRPDWLAWAEAHGDPYKWRGNTRGVFAFMRTDYLDPDGSRRDYLQDKSFRLLVSESTLPPGQGLASSSALPGLLTRGIQPFLPPNARLDAGQLNDMDYVAYVGGDRAGTSDMTSINMGRLGKISVLHSFPEREGETVTLPDDFRFFVVNSSAVKRLDDTGRPAADQDLARFIKSMTGMGPALAAVWLRHLSRTRPEYGRLESLLMSHPAGHPFGLLRELTAIGLLGDPERASEYAEMVGGTDPASRADFVARLLSQIPNGMTVGQMLQEIRDDDLKQLVRDLLAGFSPLGADQADGPDAVEALKMESVIPLRQLATYGIAEIERGVAYVAAAQAGDARQLVRLMRRAHDGDRAVWTLGADGALETTPWGKTEPPEAFFRSIPEADAVVDEFQSQMDSQFGENAGAARTMAAGLGMGLAVGVVAEAYPAAKRFWRERGFDLIEVQPGGGAFSVQMAGAPARAAAARMEASGLEEASTQGGLILAVELGGSDLRTALVDASGQILKRIDERFTFLPGTRPEDEENRGPILNQVVGQIRRLMREAPGLEVSALVVSAPGDKDEETGFVRKQFNLPLWPMNLPEEIRRGLGLEVPAALVDDTRAALLAEIEEGGLQPEADELVGYLTVSTGVDFAVQDGSGRTANLEIGALSYGAATVEETASGRHLARLARERIERMEEKERAESGANELIALAGGEIQKITAEEVGKAYRQDNALAAELLREAAAAVGSGIVRALEQMDRKGWIPEGRPRVRITAGGGVVEGIDQPFIDLIDEELRAALAESPVRERIGRVRLSLSRLNGRLRGLLGASVVGRDLIGAGLEESVIPQPSVETLRGVPPLQRERGALPLPAASGDRRVLGVVAGPNGLAYGYALGKVTPAVAYVVETAEEGRALEQALAVSPNAVFVAGALGGVKPAARAAEEWLGQVWGAGEVKRLGVDGPVPQTIQLLLRELFLIELNPEEWAPWSAFIDKVERALAQAVAA